MISIHAPTSGATRIRGAGERRWTISIHAPTSGATRTVEAAEIKPGISIHAPTSGATLNNILDAKFKLFQSTLPQVERQDHGGCMRKGRYFNPRSHKWSDQDMYFSGAFLTDFNPRSHKWSDIICHHIHNIFPISIHAPTSGATNDVFEIPFLLSISIHAPTSGATCIR